MCLKIKEKSICFTLLSFSLRYSLKYWNGEINYLCNMFNKILNKDSINTIEIVHIFMMNRLPYKKINFRFCLSDPRHPVTSTFRDGIILLTILWNWEKLCMLSIHHNFRQGVFHITWDFWICTTKQLDFKLWSNFIQLCMRFLFLSFE